MRPTTFAAALLMVGALVACDDSEPTATVTDLSPQIVAALDTAINDEFHAEYIYLRVLADFGNVLPFFNVVVAEQRHSASLAALFERRGLTVPPNRWNLDNVPRFPSTGAACAGAATAELANIAMYDRLLTLAAPADVRLVLSNNRAASVERHYPAFLRCGQ
jgi:hypothetical protein